MYKEMNRKCFYIHFARSKAHFPYRIIALSLISCRHEISYKTLINVPAYTLADSKFGMAKAVFWCHFYFSNNYWSFLLHANEISAKFYNNSSLILSLFLF